MAGIRVVINRSLVLHGDYVKHRLSAFGVCHRHGGARKSEEDLG